MGDAEELGDAGDDGVDEVVESGWAVIKGGAGGADDGAGAGEGGHVVDVDGGEGHFTVDEDERASLFEGDVGGAEEEGIGEACGEGGEGVGRAGADGHGVGGIGAGGEGAEEVVVVVPMDAGAGAVEEGFGGEFGQVKFTAGDAAGVVGGEEVKLAAGAFKDVEESAGVDLAAGAGEGENGFAEVRHGIVSECGGR